MPYITPVTESKTPADAVDQTSDAAASDVESPSPASNLPSARLRAEMRQRLSADIGIYVRQAFMERIERRTSNADGSLSMHCSLEPPPWEGDRTEPTDKLAKQREFP
ncbi:hypothetical protein CPLU01_15431 [Colletotrichum plurivorum]|uniref:Uncharacterized protein n=1 Tax=Colletotrichum plurivorum TaxID=2175906 RepID=A0A8H6MVP8_9PEZI|nr:hypothetical protein CPLU01_15431 [Colletotrichum plurivorum]